VAEENEELSSKFDEWDEWEEVDANNCRECAADHRQLAEWLTELKEAKRLLALAVEDFKTIGEVRATPTPMIHPKYREYTRIIDILDLNWRHTDEALKLIGND
jgi:hypothetical protein